MIVVAIRYILRMQQEKLYKNVMRLATVTKAKKDCVYSTKDKRIT